jgi:hypothetical protein
MHDLHMSLDAPLPSANIEIAEDLVLKWGESIIEASEWIGDAAVALVWHIEGQQMVRADHPDAMNPRTICGVVSTMNPSAIARLGELWLRVNHGSCQ